MPSFLVNRVLSGDEPLTEVDRNQTHTNPSFSGLGAGDACIYTVVGTVHASSIDKKRDCPDTDWTHLIQLEYSFPFDNIQGNDFYGFMADINLCGNGVVDCDEECDAAQTFVSITSNVFHFVLYYTCRRLISNTGLLYFASWCIVPVVVHHWGFSVVWIRSSITHCWCTPAFMFCLPHCWCTPAFMFCLPLMISH